MYTLYIANKNYSSWSLRPWVLMKVLEIPFAEKLTPFPVGPSWTLFRTFSPSGRVPALHDGDTVVWDSLAITEYLAEHHEGVWATDPKARTWSRSVAAEMHSGFSTLRNACTMNVGLRIELGVRPPALEADIARIAEIWADGLERFGGPFLAGDKFTAADAFYCPIAFRAQTYAILDDPVSSAYVGRLLSLPAMQQWYEAGIAETFREAAHEEEAAAAGVWVQDLRAKA